jgi:HNH endonuclease
MSDQSTLTQKQLKDFLLYDLDTGVFTWIKAPGYRNTRIGLVGKAAGRLHHDGYIGIVFKGRWYGAHRLAWFYAYGVWPQDQLDHINGIRSDNRLCNLREANANEQMQNRKRSTRKKDGLPLGVFAQSRVPDRFQAVIQVNGRRNYLGTFCSVEEASAAYATAKAELHDFQPLLRPT